MSAERDNQADSGVGVVAARQRSQAGIALGYGDTVAEQRRTVVLSAHSGLVLVDSCTFTTCHGLHFIPRAPGFLALPWRSRHRAVHRFGRCAETAADVGRGAGSGTLALRRGGHLGRLSSTSAGPGVGPGGG